MLLSSSPTFPHCPTKQINNNYQIVNYLFYQLLAYMKIIETISSVTQATTNVALLAIYSTVSNFTKTTVQCVFSKFGAMMNTITADVTDRYRYWIFSFCRRSRLIWLTFDGLPIIRIGCPSLVSPSTIPILNYRRVSCDFFGFLSWIQWRLYRLQV